MSERLALLCDIEDGLELCGQLAASRCVLCSRDCCTRHRSDDKLQIYVRINERSVSDPVGRLGHAKRVMCVPCAFALKQQSAAVTDSVLSEGTDWDASVLVAARALVAAHKLKESA